MDAVLSDVRLTLSSDDRRHMAAAALAAAPREACGLLVGLSEGGGGVVSSLTSAANLASECDRFDLDPAAWLAAEELARASELAVIGVWHSHVEHAAVPSPRDVAGAPAGLVHVIVSVRDGRAADIRAWRIDASRATELELR